MDDISDLFGDPTLHRWAEFYNSMRHPRDQCNFAKYSILYLYGGLYVDTHYIANKPADILLERKQLLLVWEPPEHKELICPNSAHCLATELIGSVPWHPMWPQLMDYIMNNYQNYTNDNFDSLEAAVNVRTGAIAFSAFLAKSEWKHIPWLLSYCLVRPHNMHKNVTSGCRENYEHYAVFFTGTQNSTVGSKSEQNT